MSELENKLILSYNNMSLSGKYTYGYLSGYRQCVVDLQKIEEQTQLNENQQIVLEQLCLIYIKQIYKSSLQAVYIFIKNGMSDAYLNLDRKEADQVLEAFARLAQEQEGEI